MRLHETGNLRVLDFDIENRPLSYLGPEFTTTEVTAIGCCFIGEPKSFRCWLLGADDPETMFSEFTILYDSADMVTGHYIRAHDLPIINGALMERSARPLGPKLTSDTKLDLIRRSGISASQESLAAMLGIKDAKYHMNQHKWRTANRLLPEGLEETRKRVTGDVVQHMELRRKLVELGMIGPPKVWTP